MARIIKSKLLMLAFSLNTLLCFGQISPVSNGSWQDTSIWPGAQLPGNSDEVVIPVGFIVGLTGNIAVKSITVNGTLSAISGASIDLQTEWILVMGSNALFEIGTAVTAFNSSCIITLTGLDDGDDIMGMGDKFIIAMNGGNIEFHGEQKASWSHLGTTVNSGSNQITMATPIDWTVGDEIVLVASSTDWEEAEKKTITAINGNGLNITLNSNLSYPHAGIVKTYTRSTDNKTWTADLRAEVGLLTHNIKIQGDASSETNGFGGHIMAMPNSTINASSIELYRMGQKTKLGRYPFHWHMLDGFGAGQYFINSSVHHSFNRAITIHGTSYVNVENNFFYDHIGHGVFLEDGSERFNTIRNNVTLLSKRPLAGEELTPSDNELNEVQNRTPSSFWITNPNNIFEGNVAAGTQGTGYWFSMPKSPMGASASDPRYAGIEPYKEPLGSFKNNKAHSCMSGFDIYDQLNPDHSIKKNAGWLNSNQHLIEDCTWYANDLALYTGIGGGVGDKIIYTGNLIFKNNVIIDNVTNMMFASYSQVQESVFVASGRIAGSSLYRIYDGAGQLRDCHLVGWNANMNYLKEGGAATKHTNHRISGITTDDGELPVVKLRDYDIPISNTNFTPQSLSHPRVWNVVLYDEDGSFSGAPNSSIVSNHPMMLVGDEFQPSNWVNAYRSPHKFALSFLTFPGLTDVDYPNLTCTRSKTGTPTESVYYMYGYKEKIQLPFIVGEDFIYNYQFESLPSTKSINVFMDDAEAGDTYLLRFQDFGKLGGLSFNVPLPEYTSMNDLTNSNQGGFLTEPNGDLYVKIVAIQHLQSLNISWSTNFNVPILDTDGDGISDRQEIINGTDPFDETTANIKVYLQGAYDPATGTMTTHLVNNNLLPNSQPFNTSPWNYNGNESVATINDIPTNAVDWVLIELRDAASSDILIAQRAAFLLSDGSLQDVNGLAGASFLGITANNYQLVVRSRNHLDIISANTHNIAYNTSLLLDLTDATNVLNGSEQLATMSDGSYALLAGDIDGSGIITVADFNKCINDMSLINTYITSDLNLDNAVTIADFNIYQVNASAIGVNEIRY